MCHVPTHQGRYGNAVHLNDGGDGPAIYIDQIDEPCFSNTSACDTGFTMMVWLKMADLDEYNTTHYYISAGEMFGSYEGMTVASIDGLLWVQVRSAHGASEPIASSFPLFSCELC